ncbi:MAG: UDP-N-acetylmuramate dehydrogenase [Bacteroidia bacterium]|nr:UDP-N-acetylmuramate dehydrogenase [Bacteroidia bacterium]
MPLLKEHISLKPFNTFGINAYARWFIELQSIEQAVEFVTDNHYQNQEMYIIGGGSNVLITQNFEGVVVKNSIHGKRIVKETESHIWLKVGAGENWHKLVLHCLENDWGGIENLSLIPGNVGAAPIQNIGAYGVEVKEVFECLEAIHLATGNIHVFHSEDCKFGYRDSIFKHEAKGKYLITSVTFKLTRKDHQLNTSYAPVAKAFEESGESPSIQKISKKIVEIRSSKLPDPKVIGNAGSFFKNPVVSKEEFEIVQEMYERVPNYPAGDGKVKLAAGWLIEKCGWKGQRFGEYGVHSKQALVLVNHGDASGKKILELSERIQKSVKNHFGIQLEREVNIL